MCSMYLQANEVIIPPQGQFINEIQLSYMAPNGQGFKNCGLPGNAMPFKRRKVRMSKSQNKEEGTTNNQVSKTNNLGVFPNYCEALFLHI